jgi:hypothetical protein
MVQLCRYLPYVKDNYYFLIISIHLNIIIIYFLKVLKPSLV